MNIFLFLSIALLLTLLGGYLIERLRIPWIFSALFLGLLLSIYNPFSSITNSDTFIFISNLGMYFLLFMIGLGLDIKEILKQGRFIPKLSFWIIFSQSLLGTIFIHYLFHMPLSISILTATSFATVGEAILMPILDEFSIVKTQFGQILLGVGTIDDVVELATIILASIIMGTSMGHSNISFIGTFTLLVLLFVIPILLQIYHSRIPHLKFKRIPSLFLFGLVVLFAFLGVGSFVDSAALGAIFAGVSLRNLLSYDKIRRFKTIMRIIAYGLFVPMFFIYVGMNINLEYLFSVPLLIISVLLITNITNISTSYVLSKAKLGAKKAILLGVGLSAKFSTSIVIITMLYTNSVLTSELYSVLIGSMIVSQFVIPVVFARLLQQQKLKFVYLETH